MTPTIAILGALDKEVRHIYNAVERGTVTQEAGLQVWGGAYHGFTLVATVAGMGTVNAAAAAQHLVSRYQAHALIFSGIAGSLDTRLDAGDVVIGSTLRYLDTDTPLIAESAPGLEEFHSSDFIVDIAAQALEARGFAPLEASLDQARKLSATSPFARTQDLDRPARYLRGCIATGNRFVTGSEARQRVVDATGAACVEMEGAAVAHVAAKNGIDCLVLRAISDSCNESYEALSARQFDLERYARDASDLTLAVIRRLANHLGIEQR